jgi:signal transduction histidine kinase
MERFRNFSPLVQQYTWAVDITNNGVLFCREEVQSRLIDDNQKIPWNSGTELLEFLKLTTPSKSTTSNLTTKVSLVKMQRFKINSKAGFTAFENCELVFGTSKYLSSERLKTMQIETIEKISRLKNNFSNNITHEFKAPISRILGLSEMIRQQFNIPELGQYVDLIEIWAKKLKFSAESILEYSKWENREHQYTQQTVPLESLFKKVVESSKESISLKSIQIELQVNPKSLTVQSDPFLLKETTRLLLMNSIENTSMGRISLIASAQRKNEILVVIEDSWIGIPNDLISAQTNRNLLNGFSRIKEPSLQKQRSGLILSMALEYIKELKGSINIQ